MPSGPRVKIRLGVPLRGTTEIITAQLPGTFNLISLLPFDRLQFIGDLTPLIDKIEVDHADCRIWAS